MRISAILRNMSTFKHIINPITGVSEWELFENYDFHQEIARSGFADMLHDTERNKKYYQALRKAINTMHCKGKKAIVLDIGTGTGILSMMAVRCGADTVIACEAFTPMAICAAKIIAKNKMENRIKIVQKRSTDVKVGDGVNDDMNQRANILVTEIFDTELIGEGAIGTFNHAHAHLLETDCIVIPDSATIYMQIVESSFARAWNKPNSLANLDGEIIIDVPKTIIQCPGSISLHDVQLNQFDSNRFVSIIDPQVIFNFDWSGKSGSIPKNRSTAVKSTVSQNGQAQIVFMWWDLQMDKDGEIILSCAPYWWYNRNKPMLKHGKQLLRDELQWRDHWMQAIYYLPKEKFVHKNESLIINCNHDEFSLWFNIQDSEITTSAAIANVVERRPPPPLCICDFHIAYSRTRIGQQNDANRSKKYIEIIENEIDNQSIVLNVSDGSLFGLLSSSLGAKHVYYIESNKYSNRNILQFIEYNQLKNITVFENIMDFCAHVLNQNVIVTHIIAEPSFISSILPWDNFYFANLLNQIPVNCLSTNIKILPKSANIYVVPVEFTDLHKIRTPLGTCEGFNLDVFDEYIEKSTGLTDAQIEAQPLWEYPCKALAHGQQLLQLDFQNLNFDFDKSLEIPITIDVDEGQCNGIVLWVDWNLNDKHVVTTGPINTIVVSKFIDWDVHTRQGVHLLSKSLSVNRNSIIVCNLKCNILKGIINFNFNM